MFALFKMSTSLARTGNAHGNAHGNVYGNVSLHRYWFTKSNENIHTVA